MKKKIYKTVEASLKGAEINYHVDDDIMFSFGVKGDHANFDVRLLCEDNTEVLLAAVTCGLCIPKDKIDRMCRWVVEKNYTLTLGEFKMDTRDGELSFRLACTLDGGAVNKDIVGVVISQVINIFDNSYEELVKAMYMEKTEDEDWVQKMIRDAARQAKEVFDSPETETNKRMSN